LKSVSVVIATRDRAASLQATLVCVANLSVPGGWSAELVVVDNGSSDETADVAARGLIAGAAARVISEPAPGVSRARNRGASESSGEVLLFLDDDIRPPVLWLTALATPIFDGLASATVSQFRLGRDRQWLSDRDRAMLMSEHSIEPLHPFLVGGSMAISREAFIDAGGFEEELGPGALGPGGEDLLLTYILQAAGRSILFVEDLEVLHEPAVEKLERSALTRRAVGEASSDAWLAYHWFGRSDPLAADKSRLLSLASKLARGNARTDLAVRASWHAQMAIEQRRCRRFDCADQI
jgi:glycosyltransferase involved in cell wall biosynthesis